MTYILASLELWSITMTFQLHKIKIMYIIHVYTASLKRYFFVFILGLSSYLVLPAFSVVVVLSARILPSSIVLGTPTLQIWNREHAVWADCNQGEHAVWADCNQGEHAVWADCNQDREHADWALCLSGTGTRRGAVCIRKREPAGGGLHQETGTKVVELLITGQI